MTPDVLTDHLEQSLLADLAAQVEPPNCIVELGVFRGGSLAILAAHAPPGVPVYGVDTFGGAGTPGYYRQDSSWVRWWERRAGRNHSWTENHQHARAAAPTARLIVADTAEIGRTWLEQTWDAPRVGLLYIDADHSYEGVRADWEAWTPHLAPSAAVVFDDYRHIVRGKDHYPDVTRFVDELDVPVTRVGKAALIRP